MLRAGAILLSLSLMLGLNAVPAHAFAATPEAEAQVTAPATPATVDENSTDDVDALSQREAAAPQLQEFVGGHDEIYIGSGVLVLVLVIVLILLIIR